MLYFKHFFAYFYCFSVKSTYYFDICLAILYIFIINQIAKNFIIINQM